MADAEWAKWELEEHVGATIGGHSYCVYDNAITDFRNKSEKAYYATGKCQVLHFHAKGGECTEGINECQVFGTGCPRIHTPRFNGSEYEV